MIPYGGYQLGYVQTDPNVEYRFKGPFYGMAFGRKLSSLGVALNYERASFILTQTSPDYYFSSDKINQSIHSVMFGPRCDLLFTKMIFSFNYFWKVKWNVVDGADSGSSYQGKGYGIGVGYKKYSHLAFHLEYRNIEMTTFTDSQNLETDLAANKLTVVQYLFLISLPF